ncbi:YicC/YloC family endoribonuclease [Polystyrenella longa]|nr:YicC/YloC family endoribonuclease [Polystyrenella longa]
MTGFGDARVQEHSMNVAVEIRAVNNRYFKLSLKSPDSYARYEGDIERVVREVIRRGTVQIAISVQQMQEESRYEFNEPALQEYWNQYRKLASDLPGVPDESPALSSFFQLPGIIREKPQAEEISTEEWNVIEKCLRQALSKLQTFREKEGESIRQDLGNSCKVVRRELETVEERAPLVVSEYRSRMLSRLDEVLSEQSVTIEASDIIREVGIFTDRCDINEEISRLKSHLNQFESFLSKEESMGRKLEFLSQEMFREVNTIGSKANDITISHAVVEMKASVERVRENLQNAE